MYVITLRLVHDVDVKEESVAQDILQSALRAVDHHINV